MTLVISNLPSRSDMRKASQRAGCPGVNPESLPHYVPLSRNFCHDSEIVREFYFPYRFLFGQVARSPRIDISTSPLQTEFPETFEDWYHLYMGRFAERWEHRALRIRKGLQDGDYKYAMDRSRSLRMSPSARVAECGKRKIVVRCGCRHVRVPVPCGVRWLCPTCQRVTQRKQFSKLKRAMRMHDKAWQRAKEKRSWRLLTLTIRHSGNLTQDRAKLIIAWKRLRQWAWARVGKFPFALVWELTPGRDSLGHLHAHVAVLWPRLCYHAVRAEWLRATGSTVVESTMPVPGITRIGDRSRWTVRKYGDSHRIDIRVARKGSGGSAKYLAKYTSKGIDLTEIAAETAAAAIAANYNQRLVTTSHQFWKPRLPICPSCQEVFRLQQKPRPLNHSVPFACWDAIARRHGQRMVGCGRAPPVDPR